MTLVAGIDSSTQSTKVLVCDAASGEVVRRGSAPHPEGTEVDPAAWTAALATACTGGLLEGVAAISVAGQQHGLVLLDDRRDVVRPALLWNDTRSAQAARDLTAELGGRAAWTAAVGSALVASFTITKLRWVAEHEPDLAARAAHVLLPHDWLTSTLLPGASLVTDRGDASGTGWWSPASGQYRPDLLERAFGRGLGLPEVLPPAAAAGTTAGGVLVAAGTGDNMAAALGLGLEPGDAVVSLGTSGTAFMVHDGPVDDVTGAVAGFADATGRWLPLVATLNAARVLVATAQLLGTDLAGLDALALQAPAGADGLVLLPYLDGERTPDLPHATGTLAGLTRRNLTPACMARAAVEGMLCGLADAVAALARQGAAPSRLLLVGGAAKSTAVQAIAPDLLGLPVVLPAAEEHVAVGAARQAGWALTGALPDWTRAAAQVLEPQDVDAGTRVRTAYAGLREQAVGETSAARSAGGST